MCCFVLLSFSVSFFFVVAGCFLSSVLVVDYVLVVVVLFFCCIFPCLLFFFVVSCSQRVSVVAEIQGVERCVSVRESMVFVPGRGRE